ncbi:hypothetical protein SPRG_01715 [Saprolegnia parasitica CBS 223.65]|uniref:DUF7492 domain-containing protein n=1 Tax=Saprolegnia parasitica (strain CBS 223.65) TaxID=695850 RepID=A0A067D553_SAPPC|nr:hypothetical protein SPRG_01715 [Saprolegnia parasitica CBS 223.65]KDO33836.1 hypothetical protein SPRG_01715 [Saprolegnia parasitica CBS 223.65]|eukprot:XP_012195472.1 hypothetical protein SPRG_01715 [Saprolegnia parasitica CBS 223.65]
MQFLRFTPTVARFHFYIPRGMRTSVVLLSLTSFWLHDVHAHSWLDAITCGDQIGYARNFSSRDALLRDGIVFDRFMTYRLENRNASQLLCAPTQRQPLQRTTHPRLVCAPGATVTFYYNENGHVTKDKCQPKDPRGCDGIYPKNTPWYVYWDVLGSNKTTRNDTTPLGSKANDTRLMELGRGFFDDGLCGETTKYGQPRARQGRPCTGSFQLPFMNATTRNTKNTTTQVLSLVWHWVFDKVYGVGEEYTTCFDIALA